MGLIPEPISYRDHRFSARPSFESPSKGSDFLAVRPLLDLFLVRTRLWQLASPFVLMYIPVFY